MTEVVEKKTATPRVKRTPINGVRNILNVKGKDPNYHYRIVNDTDNRIEQLQEAGYEIVTAGDHEVGDKRVGKATATGSPVELSVGGGVRAYVMRIKKEWHEEDQKARSANRDQLMSQIQAETRKDGNYGSIKIE